MLYVCFITHERCARHGEAEKPGMSGDTEILAGQPAPDVTLEKGVEAVRLSEFWKDSPLAAIFMRHLG